MSRGLFSRLRIAWDVRCSNMRKPGVHFFNAYQRAATWGACWLLIVALGLVFTLAARLNNDLMLLWGFTTLVFAPLVSAVATRNERAVLSHRLTDRPPLHHQ